MAAPAWLQPLIAEVSPVSRYETTLRSVVARVQALAQRRLVWLAVSRAESSEGRTTAQRSGGVFDGTADLEAEQRWYAECSDSRVQALNRELETADAELEQDSESPLAEIVTRLALTEAERDVLHVCLAVALEPRLSLLLDCLHADGEDPYLTEPLTAELCGRRMPLLLRDGALLRWRLVREGAAAPGQAPALVIDPYVVERVSGHDATDSVLTPYLTPLVARESPESWAVGELADAVRLALAQRAQVRVIVRGPQGSGRSTFAACVARLLDRGAFRIETETVPEAERAEVRLHAVRHALLGDHAVVWRGTVIDGPPRPPQMPDLQFLTGDVDLELPANPSGIDEVVTLPNLRLDERRELWKRLVPASSAWPAPELEQVVERYRVQVSDIVSIGLRGAISAERAREECRHATRHRLGELGQLLECRFTREDLVVAPGLHALLDELVFEASERSRFWENAGARRLFPRGRGLVALMTGAPGTGKTMAAQVIAGELGLDLFRVDLATMISKYIGETAKNLKRVFARAAEANAVLLFDEADALFSKRTEVRDAHDRHANTDTNYLLQMLEDFDGVALLASNRRANIDGAFTRRIRFIMDFRMPGTAERLQIWKRVIRELEGESVEQSVTSQLEAAAEGVELSGAQIKQAALSAHFSARRTRQPLRGAHLYQGIRRELGKVARNLDSRERKRIERHDR